MRRQAWDWHEGLERDVDRWASRVRRRRARYSGGL